MVIVVPTLRGAGSRRSTTPPAIRIIPPTSSAATRESMVQRLTDAMLARASPRKPKEDTCRMSAAETILLVAWRSKARGSSRNGTPWPSSSMTISVRPPSAT